MLDHFVLPFEKTALLSSACHVASAKASADSWRARRPSFASPEGDFIRIIIGEVLRQPLDEQQASVLTRRFWSRTYRIVVSTIVKHKPRKGITRADTHVSIPA